MWLELDLSMSAAIEASVSKFHGNNLEKENKLVNFLSSGIVPELFKR